MNDYLLIVKDPQTDMGTAVSTVNDGRWTKVFWNKSKHQTQTFNILKIPKVPKCRIHPIHYDPWEMCTYFVFALPVIFEGFRAS